MAKLRAWKCFSVVMTLMLVLGLCAAAGPLGCRKPDPVVTIPDAGLEAAIREALNKPEGDVYASELAWLQDLDAAARGIQDLRGLEYCTDLAVLILAANQISDISPLANLTSLPALILADNQISDISPLANLTNLTWGLSIVPTWRF
jgi:internalin A